MAEFKMQHVGVQIAVTMTLDEEEVRALEALGGYGDNAFIKVFYEGLGKTYLAPYEAGLRRFLQSARGLAPIINTTDKARAAIRAALEKKAQ